LIGTGASVAMFRVAPDIIAANLLEAARAVTGSCA
jgi:hypothetical protein